MIKKSSRHQKIIGNFGENLICNFLSRSGFEVSIIDHTGIDIIAYNPITGERLGITVKSRTRNEGTEYDAVNILSKRGENNDRDKLLNACKAFNSTPWIGVYIETQRTGNLYLTSLQHFDDCYNPNTSRVIDSWSMKQSEMQRYSQDLDIKHIEISYLETNWWKS